MPKLILCIDVQTVAIIKAPENYKNLAEGFKDVFGDVNGLIASPQLNINGETYTVVFFCVVTTRLVQLMRT